MRRSLIKGVGVALLVLVLAAPAQAAVENGKIAFTRTHCSTPPPACISDIWTVKPDGTNLIQLTRVAAAEDPAWSFDGQRLAFVSGAGEIYTIHEDGTDIRHVLRWDPGIYGLSWSPDGSRLAAALSTCTAPNQCSYDIQTMRTDGTDVTDITPGPYDSFNPAWSPDGSRIAFDSPQGGARVIWAVDADGSDLTQLTHRTSGTDSSPAWSRDGSKIVFDSDREGGAELFTMNPDGTNIQRITSGSGRSSAPVFSPDGAHIAFYGARDGLGIHRMPSTGGSAVQLTNNFFDHDPAWQLKYQKFGRYPRPEAATPLVTSLVPAFRACETPNRVHGPPLAKPSCAPPAQVSQQLTVGTPDANGRQARGRSSARVSVRHGNPATLDDEADVAIKLEVLDVYRRSDLSDYAGELDMRVTVRITDRDNRPLIDNSGGGTVQDITFTFPGLCTPTVDTTTGASCAVNTTLDSILPGIVKEGARAVWELDQVQVYDGGEDGHASSGPNDLFQVQGLFVP